MLLFMVEPTSPASPMSADSAVSTDDEAIVASFTTVLEAEMARGRLEADGIGARVVDANTAGIATHLAMAIGGVKIAVAKSDFEAARAILFSPSALVEPFPDEVAADEEEERDLAAAPSADVLANRALRAAVVGFIAPPLGHLWSLYLLGTAVFSRRSELSTTGRRQATIAATIDAAVLGSLGYVLATVL
jgi:hypothetical protein